MIFEASNRRKANAKKFIDFFKLSASGNDFVIIDARKYGFDDADKIYLAKRLCKRESGIGADGVIFMENSDIANLKMRYFNSDGSEAKMCGNGVRCTAWCAVKLGISPTHKIETLAGVVAVAVDDTNVKVSMPPAKLIKEDIEIIVDDSKMKFDLWDTGVPHAVSFTCELEKISVDNIGKLIRFHQYFAPDGTNVDFVQVIDKHTIQIRTYERGVERETLACGTGAVASAIAGAYRMMLSQPVQVYVRFPDVLLVNFDKVQKVTENITLSGKVIFCFEGRFPL